MRFSILPVLLVIAGAALLGLGLMQEQATVAPEPPITIRSSPGPTASADVVRRTQPPTARLDRLPTRVVIRALGVDLPIIAQPGNRTSYPPCDVAMYLRDLSRPGFGGVTYIYAHAREGMFLPLLEQSQIDDGQSMLGITVQVYTSDAQLFTYRVDEIRRHVVSLAPAVATRDEELWLQTSEGPSGTPGKLELIAEPIAQVVATQADARPKPRPVTCG